MTSTSREGWSELIWGGYFSQLVILSSAVWLHAADSLMVATLIPGIIDDIGGAKLISWSITLYEVGTIVAGAAGALLSLKYGLRMMLTYSALLYGVGCLISALAPEMVILLFGRLLQGLGGGGMVALTFVAATRLFPRSQVPRVIAAISVVWGASAFIGPLVGGIFAELEFWQGGFYFFAVQALLMSACMFFGLRRGMASKSETASKRIPGRIPIYRLAVLSAGIVCIAFAGVNVSPIWSPILVAAGLLILWKFLDMDSKREDNRLLPLNPLNIRQGVGSALVLVFCFSAATIAISIYGPIIMIVLYGATALEAGYVIALCSVGWAVLAILTSEFSEKHEKAMILVGISILTLSIAGFMIVVPGGSITLIAIFAFLEGAGFGIAWVFILRRATDLTTNEEKDRVAAALPTMQRSGYAIGAAYVGIIANAAGFSDQIDTQVAKDVGFWIFAMLLPLAAFGMVAAWNFVQCEIKPSNS